VEIGLGQSEIGLGQSETGLGQIEIGLYLALDRMEIGLGLCRVSQTKVRRVSQAKLRR